MQALFPHMKLSPRPAQGLERFYATLNFRQSENASDSYCWILTAGNCFDRHGRGFDQNENGRPQMVASVRQLVDLIELDLLRQNIVIHDMGHMRVSFVKGANTLLHVDDLRGVTDTHVMITKQNLTNMLTLCPFVSILQMLPCVLQGRNLLAQRLQSCHWINNGGEGCRQ
jgi:hypothetical protein